MPQEGKAIVHRGEIRSYSYSGILPPPEMLNQYNMIEPDWLTALLKWQKISKVIDLEWKILESEKCIKGIKEYSIFPDFCFL